MSWCRLDELRTLAKAHDAELCAWLEAAIERWQDGDDLALAMELRGAGAVRERDSAIRRAAMLADPECQIRPWTLAGDIAGQIERFGVTKWRRQSSNLSEFERAIFEAFRASDNGGIPMLKSQRRIYDLIR